MMVENIDGICFIVNLVNYLSLLSADKVFKV